MLFKKSAGAVVFYRSPESEIEYLLLEHKSYWHFPKGWREAGEKAIDTAKREVTEETGLSDFKFIDGFKARESFVYKTTKDSRKIEQRGKIVFKTVIFYLIQAEGKNIKISSEHLGYEWLDFELAMERLKQFKSSQRILGKANKFLNGYFPK